MRATEQEEIKRIPETPKEGGRVVKRSPQHCQLLFVKFSSSSSSIKWSSTAQTTIPIGCFETHYTIVTSANKIFRTMQVRSILQPAMELDMNEYTECHKQNIINETAVNVSDICDWINKKRQKCKYENYTGIVFDLNNKLWNKRNNWPPYEENGILRQIVD